MVRDKKCINTLHVNLEQIMENATFWRINVNESIKVCINFHAN